MISEEDSIKIRRLILTKLFKGWSVQARLTKANHFKASQIIARMMRRSNGPLWLKEVVLVSFHMWRRYSAVKVCTVALPYDQEIDEVNTIVPNL